MFRPSSSSSSSLLLVLFLLSAAILLSLFAEEAEAGMLMGKGAGRGRARTGPRRRPWDTSRRYDYFKELRDNERNAPDIPKYDYAAMGRPEPCVGVCYYMKQLAAARKAKESRRKRTMPAVGDYEDYVEYPYYF